MAERHENMNPVLCGVLSFVLSVLVLLFIGWLWSRMDGDAPTNEWAVAGVQVVLWAVLYGGLQYAWGRIRNRREG